MMDQSILFVSNGLGEDTIAASVALEMKKRAGGLSLLALPLVGEGRAYESIGIRSLGPRRMMPSGGLIPESHLKNILTDIKGGFLRMTLEHIRALRKVKSSLRGIVAVGDAIPVLFSALFGRRPLVFIGTARSDYFYAYSSLEKHLFRESCSLVFPRDEATAASLRASGVNARWVGNAMMDCIPVTEEDFGIPNGDTCIGILPGSREITYRDFPILLEAVERLPSIQYFLAAPASSIDEERLAAMAENKGWRRSGLDDDSKHGIAVRLSRSESHLLIVKERFGDVLKCSSLIIGQAGTANEQAVGMGKPVVSYDSYNSRKPGWYRARQKGLLGEALSVVSRDSKAIASEVVRILGEPALYQMMQEAGFQRMGPPGAAGKMAESILKEYGVGA